MNSSMPPEGEGREAGVPVSPGIGLVPARVGLAHSLGPVADDWTAAEVWLAILKARPVAATTLATYTREIRRLRWYCEQRQRPLPSAWTYQDTLAYGEFLQHEAHHYVCPSGLRPNDPAWTPFRGRLAPQSIAAAHKITGQLFAFWQEAGYIGRSPYSGWGQARKVARESPSRRAVPPQLIELVLRCMEERKKRTPIDYLRYYRNRFVILLLLGTGLRAHEAVACDMSDVQSYSDPDPAQPKIYWGLCLRVQKGGKDERTVYLDEPVMQALREYRRASGLSPAPQRAETYGLILSPLTERSQGRQAKHRRRSGRAGAVCAAVKVPGASLKPSLGLRLSRCAKQESMPRPHCLIRCLRTGCAILLPPV